MTPRVSVVIAARDAADTLAATLASVAGQTAAGWEVVLVDDGSVDATGDVARAAGLDALQVLRHDTARGPGAARNAAIRAARGELIATLDADDRWHPGYLERQLAVLDHAVAEGRRVGVVCCDAALVGADGPTGGRWSERVGYRGGPIDLEAMLDENVVFTSVLGPREAFLEVGGYEEDDRLHLEDYDLWLRMLERGYELVWNPEVLADYRLADDARSARAERMAAGGAMIMTRALRRGALTAHQRRLARKRRRMYEVVGRRARLAAEPSPARRALGLARAAPAIARSTLEHPERWAHWLRNGPRSAGRDRHAGA